MPRFCPRRGSRAPRARWRRVRAAFAPNYYKGEWGTHTGKDIVQARARDSVLYDPLVIVNK
jgi:hypothetical protein